MAVVMVIDDDYEVRLMLGGLIEKEGHQVLPAKSATEAWSMLDRLPDAIFADIDMGDESGVTFVERLREHPTCAKVPVVFVTAHPKDAKPLTAKGAGVVDVIHKPFRVELILGRLRQMLKTPVHRPATGSSKPVE